MNERDHLAIGGCDTAELAAEFGTPLLVFDDATLRGMCRGFVDAFTARYANSEVLYAAKAFVNGAIAKIVAEEGLGLDVVSGGELAVADAAGADMSRVYFHGNNKTPDELEYALDVGCGRVVVDSFYEMGMLNDPGRGAGRHTGHSAQAVAERGPTYSRPYHDGHTGQQVRILDRDRGLDYGDPAGDRGVEPGPGRAALSPGLADIRAGAVCDSDRHGSELPRAVQGRWPGHAGVQSLAADSPSGTCVTSFRRQSRTTRR